MRKGFAALGKLKLNMPKALRTPLRELPEKSTLCLLVIVVTSVLVG